MNDEEIRNEIKILSAQVKSLRLASNLTQKELIQRSGVAKRTLQRFENGESMSVETLLKILSVFGKTIKI